MTDFFILPEKLEDDFLLHAIVKRGGRYYTCYITMGRATIDHIPPEIFRNNIFKYLSPQDLFSLGESSSQMKNIVLENVKHSEAVHLQYLKTRKRHYLMEVSSFSQQKFHTQISVPGSHVFVGNFTNEDHGWCLNH